jgi:hypothetical protein
MEIGGAIKYAHKKEDCPTVLSMALRKKYEHIPKLGCMLSDIFLMKQLKSGLKKHNHTLKQIYGSKKNYIDDVAVTLLLSYLFKNKKDGFMVLEHNNPKETRHLFAFLYNHKKETLDFFDSYNDTRTFFTLRMDPTNIKKFIYDVFHTYFKDEFIIEKLFEFNKL